MDAGLRWQLRRKQAVGEKCGVRRVLVGPRTQVMIDSEIGIEPQRGRRQLGRAGPIVDPWLVRLRSRTEHNVPGYDPSVPTRSG